MSTRKTVTLLRKAISDGDGIVRLMPAWVPCPILSPGGRLKLAKQDLYAFGSHRGGIDERRLASTTGTENGPGILEDEGLSYIVVENSARPERILLKQAIDLLGDEFLGRKVMNKYAGWRVLTKLYDNQGSIPHHVHQTDEEAAKVGTLGKPEAYYFPPQLNQVENSFPFTFFGLEPGTSKQDVIDCLARWNEGDNGILNLTKAYRLKAGTAWNIPAGILHGPGSLVTYETQRASNVFAMYQSLSEGKEVPRDMLTKNVLPEHKDDLEYIVDHTLVWELNIDPEFGKNHLMSPVPVNNPETMLEDGYYEQWISYQSEYFSAKELTVYPNRSVTITDAAAYGIVVVQGHGLIGKMEIESPTLIRFGEITSDELFVTADAAINGVKITNNSSFENLVILKHFGPGNSDLRNIKGK
jgi:mannose-6-phosphate isomerase class I